MAITAVGIPSVTDRVSKGSSPCCGWREAGKKTRTRESSRLVNRERLTGIRSILLGGGTWEALLRWAKDHHRVRGGSADEGKKQVRYQVVRGTPGSAFDRCSLGGILLKCITNVKNRPHGSAVILQRGNMG